MTAPSTSVRTDAGARATDHDRLPVRRMAFEYPEDLDPAWSRRLPEFAFVANSVSLLMPYAEPYFVKSVRSALPQLDEPLRARAEDYLRQELGHHVQHRRLNDIIGRRYPRVPRLEMWMRRTYGWLCRTRSQRFNLAFAAASETIAFVLARWTEDHMGELFVDADPVPATLFLWHLAEEVEHKSVAYDVFEAVDGSRRRYAVAMVMSMLILTFFTTLGTLTMAAAAHRLWHPVTYVRLVRWAVSFALVGFPTMLVSSLPGHHPSALTDPLWLTQWLGHYDPVTGTMPEPGVLA